MKYLIINVFFGHTLLVICSIEKKNFERLKKLKEKYPRKKRNKKFKKERNDKQFYEKFNGLIN